MNFEKTISCIHYKNKVSHQYALFYREESKNIDSTFHRNTFSDCGEIIKIEDIKGEINEEESDEDPLSIHQENKNSKICKDIKEEVKEEESDEDPLSIHQETENSNVCEDIKEEVKEEESFDDPLSIQEGERRSENDNNRTVVKEERIDDDTLFVQEIHKSAYLIERMKSKNINHPLTQFSVLDCDGTFKEDIKKDIKEVESVEDPLSIHQKTENSNFCKTVKEEVKEEESVEVFSFNQQEIGNV